MKISKIDASLHQKAINLLAKDRLSFEDKEFIFMNYQESANNLITQSGAFFTPTEMAWDLALLAVGFTSACKVRVLDLCAGIGILANSCLLRNSNVEVVCVEINQDYVDIGKRLVPEAEWHCMDALDLDALKTLGHFDVVISNPPFGPVATGKGKKSPRYTGANFSYKLIDVAAEVADNGYFILNQADVNYIYSGQPTNSHDLNRPKYREFVEQTGWTICGSWPSDTSLLGKFKNTNIKVEFGEVDYAEIRQKQQGDKAA